MFFKDLPKLEDIENLDIPFKDEFLKETEVKSHEIKITLPFSNNEKKIITRTVLTQPYPKKLPIVLCFGELFDELADLHKSYLMNVLPLHVWFEFFKDFKEEIEEYNLEIQNLYEIEQIQLLSQKKRELINLFYIEYGFYEIEKLVKWKESCDLKILRTIRNYLRSWESYSKKTLPYIIFHFEIKDWEFFFKNHFYMVKNGYNLEKMVRFVEIKQSITLPEIQVYTIPFSYYSFFSWKKISLRNHSGKNCPINESIVRYFFHENSHFEDSTFWFDNQTPFTLYYDDIEQKDDTLYQQHKNMIDFKKGFLQCPMSLIPYFHKNKIEKFCTQKYPYFKKELWSFLFSKSNQIYGKDLLKKCFSILGRLSKDYHFFQYHHSLHEKLQKQYLSIKYIHTMSKHILFPEFDFQSKNVQNQIKERWNQVYLHFQNEFFSFLLDENQQKSILYIDIIPSFQLPPMSLLKYIGKNELFNELNKKKTYLSFFQMDNVLNITSKKTKKKILFDESKEKLENYINKCFHNE